MRRLHTSYIVQTLGEVANSGIIQSNNEVSQNALLFVLDMLFVLLCLCIPHTVCLLRSAIQPALRPQLTQDESGTQSQLRHAGLIAPVEAYVRENDHTLQDDFAFSPHQHAL